MARLVAILSVAGLLFASTGCVVPYGAPVYGGIITQDVKGPVSGVDNSVSPTNSGRATAQGILFMGMGDASIQAAMEDGGITRVHHVDSETFSVLGLYTTYTTIVWGE